MTEFLAGWLYGAASGVVVGGAIGITVASWLAAAGRAEDDAECRERTYDEVVRALRAEDGALLRSGIVLHPLPLGAVRAHPAPPRRSPRYLTLLKDRST